MTVILLLTNVTGVALWYCRMKLMASNPDAYARFHEGEKAFAKGLVAATERAVGSLVAAIKGMARLLGSKKA